MGDMRVYTEAAILICHLPIYKHWITAIVTKLTVDSCDTGRPSMQSEIYSGRRRAKDNSKNNRGACVCIIIFLLYKFYISTRLYL